LPRDTRALGCFPGVAPFRLHKHLSTPPNVTLPVLLGVRHMTKVGIVFILNGASGARLGGDDEPNP
jgi:hypothetical protein